MSDELDLARRAGLPEDMLVISRRHPRAGWDAHENLGFTARFWLERHADLRMQQSGIASAVADLREGRLEAEPFAGLLVPRLRHYLGDLEGHHRVEDFHYFPAFTEAEPSLAAGFDLMEGDHEALHLRIEAVIATANAMLQALPSGRDGFLAAADAYAEAQNSLGAGLARHLDDEEELVIPLILERTEGGLGL